MEAVFSPRIHMTKMTKKLMKFTIVSICDKMNGGGTIAKEDTRKPLRIIEKSGQKFNNNSVI